MSKTFYFLCHFNRKNEKSLEVLPVGGEVIASGVFEAMDRKDVVLGTTYGVCWSKVKADAVKDDLTKKLKEKNDGIVIQDDGVIIEHWSDRREYDKDAKQWILDAYEQINQL